MRKELEQILDSEFGYTLSDLDHTFEIVKRLDREKFECLLRRQAELEKENPDLVDDIMDDLHWYGYLESFLIWHFGLLRLQGIFEGYLVSNFLSASFKSGGLKSKLRGVIDRGYTLHDNDYHDLIEWGRIRNSLSHFPPSAYVNGILMESDVEEYLTLCKRILTDLEGQKIILSSNNSASSKI